MNHLPDGLCVSDAKWLPIIAAYVNKLGIPESTTRFWLSVFEGFLALTRVYKDVCPRCEQA
jgi:hypothetical protein